MTDKQIDELYGKGSLDKIKQYHKDASAVSTDSHDAKSYHDTSVRRTETLGKREKAKADIAKAKKGSTREKGWRNYLQAKDDSARQRKWAQKSKGELSSDEKRIHNTYLKARGVQEDAPTVNAGSGNIPGAGVAAAGKPANFGDAIVSSGAAKQWKKQNVMFRRKSPMAEEQIDELSKETLTSYNQKASKQVRGNEPGDPKKFKKRRNREAGLKLSWSKIHNYKVRVSANEEVDQLDELKRETLGRYIKKASDNRAKNQGDAEFYQKKGITPRNQKKYGKAIRNVINRRKGIRTATDKLVKEDTFAGAVVFEVNSKLFHNLTMQKRKGKHWRTYLEEDDCYAEIREWAKKNPKGKIIVRNESTGEMRYVRYGKAR